MDEREGGGERPRVSGAENSVTTDNWKRTTDVYANDPPLLLRKRSFFFSLPNFRSIRGGFKYFHPRSNEPRIGHYVMIPPNNRR